MSDVVDSKDLRSSISEFESLGFETPNLNDLNDSYEVENLKQLVCFLSREYSFAYVVLKLIINSWMGLNYIPKLSR